MNSYFSKKSLILFIILSFLPAVGCRAMSLSAELVQSENGKTTRSGFFLRDHRYRIDLVDDGQPISILVDREAGKTRIVIPSEKAFLEIANDSMQSLTKNPFEMYQYMLTKQKVRSAGRETLEGILCQKQVISLETKDAITAWVAKKYSFPLKIINHLNQKTAVLQNIRQKQVAKDIFAVPAGYRLISHMPVPAPAWAAHMQGAALIKPPFTKDVAAKQIIRVKPVKGFYLKLKLSNPTGKPARVTAAAFKNGRPLHNLSYKTYNLSTSPGASVKLTEKAQPGQADVIVVRVAKGTVKVRARLEQAPPEGIRLKRLRLKSHQGREINVDFHKPAHLVLRDEAADGRPSRGVIRVFETEARDMGNGTTVYRKKKAKHIAFDLQNGAKRTWSFSGNEKVGAIGVDVAQGAVEIRVEQPLKAGIIPPSWAKDSGSAGKAAAASPTGAAAGRPKIIFVLDASGSMWGPINGKPKIEIAREVMNDLIARLPANMRAGLMAYGHRRKGDCHDIEMLIPVGRLDRAGMKAAIKAISPKGKTPLAEAVRQAARALGYTKNRAAVVLVSDGLETCNADPCKLAQKLAMHGVDFTVHVIGFDLSKQEQARLRCLADKTGGLFLAAANAAALRNALFTTIKQVQAPPPPVKENPGKATLKAQASVCAGAVFSVRWQGPNSLRDYIAISKKGARDDIYTDYVYTKTGNPVRITAPGDTGAYELRYVHAHSHRVIGRAKIQVTPVSAQVTAPREAAVATKISVKWNGPGYKGDYISVARPDQAPGDYLGFRDLSGQNPLKLQMPPDPGTYEVRYIMAHGTKLLAKTTVTVKPAGASLEVPAEVNAAAQFQVRWQGPANGDDLITIAGPDQSPDSFLGLAYIHQGNPSRLRAPADPGTYEVRYILGQGAKLLAKTTITVKPVSASLEVPAEVNAAAQFQVRWQGPANGDDLITIAGPDQSPDSFLGLAYVHQGNPSRLTAPQKPGTYEVRYIQGYGAKPLARVKITVKAP